MSSSSSSSDSDVDMKVSVVKNDTALKSKSAKGKNKSGADGARKLDSKDQDDSDSSMSSDEQAKNDENVVAKVAWDLLSDRSVAFAKRLDAAVELGKSRNESGRSSWLLGWLLSVLQNKHLLTLSQLSLLRDLLKDQVESSTTQSLSLTPRSQLIIQLLSNRATSGLDNDSLNVFVEVLNILRRLASFRPQLDPLHGLLRFCCACKFDAGEGGKSLQQSSLALVIRELDRTVNPRRVFDFVSEKILSAGVQWTLVGNTLTRRVIGFLFQPHQISAWANLSVASASVELPPLESQVDSAAGSSQSGSEPPKKKRKKNKEAKQATFVGGDACFNAHQFSVIPALAMYSQELLPIAFNAFCTGFGRVDQRDASTKHGQQQAVCAEFGFFFMAVRCLLQRLDSLTSGASTGDQGAKDQIVKDELRCFEALTKLWQLVKTNGAFRLREDSAGIQAKALRWFRDLMIEKLTNSSQNASKTSRECYWQGLVAVLNCDVEAIEEKVDNLLTLVGSENTHANFEKIVEKSSNLTTQDSNGAVFIGKVLLAYARLGDIGRLWRAILKLLKKICKKGDVTNGFCENRMFLTSISEAISLCAFPQVEQIWKSSISELKKVLAKGETGVHLKYLATVFGAFLSGVQVKEQILPGLSELFKFTVSELKLDDKDQALQEVLVSTAIVPLVDLGRRLESWLCPPTLPLTEADLQNGDNSTVMGEIRGTFVSQNTFHATLDTILKRASKLKSLDEVTKAAITVRMLRSKSVSDPAFFMNRLLPNDENTDDTLSKGDKKIKKSVDAMLNSSNVQVENVTAPHSALCVPFDCDDIGPVSSWPVEGPALTPSYATAALDIFKSFGNGGDLNDYGVSAWGVKVREYSNFVFVSIQSKLNQISKSNNFHIEQKFLAARFCFVQFYFLSMMNLCVNIGWPGVFCGS